MTRQSRHTTRIQKNITTQGHKCYMEMLFKNNTETRNKMSEDFQTFLGCWICHCTPIIWRPQLPDLSTIDFMFFFFKKDLCMKHLFHCLKTQSIELLWQQDVFKIHLIVLRRYITQCSNNVIHVSMHLAKNLSISCVGHLCVTCTYYK